MKTKEYYAAKYKKFIQSRRLRELPAICERHHIVPRSIGGTDDPENIISLSPREHYLAHLLLYHSNPDNVKFAQAMSAMIYGNKKVNKRELTSRQYEKTRSIITKPIPQKSQLLELYFKKKFSFKKIGSTYKVSDMTVCKWFKQYNISAKACNDYGFCVPTKEALAAVIKTADTAVKDVRDYYGVSKSTAYKWLKQYELSPKQKIGIKKSIPPKKELEEIYNKIHNLKKIAKIYDVQHALVAKWMKHHEIRYRNFAKL